MSRQRSQHFDAIIQQLDTPTSDVRTMVDYLLGNQWESITASTAYALISQLPIFETFFQKFVPYNTQFKPQDCYGGLRGRLHDLFDGAKIDEIKVWLKKCNPTLKARALAIFSCRIILIIWMLEKGDTRQLTGFTEYDLKSLSGSMKEYLMGYSSKHPLKTPFKAIVELPNITPNYLTDLFRPMFSGPLPPYMESRARQVSTYAADGRRTQMIGNVGQMGLVFGCECSPSYAYRPWSG